MSNQLLMPMKDGGVALPKHSEYTFLSQKPERIGDDAVIFADGKRRHVRLLKDRTGGTHLVEVLK